MEATQPKHNHTLFLLKTGNIANLSTAN